MNQQEFLAKRAELKRALAVTAELTGTALSAAAVDVMVDDLQTYDTAAVLSALNRCRRELTGRLSLAAILERIDTGLPSADEAFGMLAEGWRNEELTVIVPEIAMTAAGNGAWELFAAGDKTGARMAFRDSYARLAADVVASGGKVGWFVSRGYNREHQATAIMDAVRKGRLTAEQALTCLPSEAAAERHLLKTGEPLPALPDGNPFRPQIAALLERLTMEA